MGRSGRGRKLAHLPAQCAAGVRQTILGIANMLETGEMLAGSTGLEPAASGVTGSVPHEPSHCAHATVFLRRSSGGKLPPITLRIAYSGEPIFGDILVFLAVLVPGR